MKAALITHLGDTIEIKSDGGDRTCVKAFAEIVLSNKNV